MRKLIVCFVGCALLAGISTQAGEGAAAVDVAAKKAKAFAKIDADGDGQVSKEEFTASVKKQFEKKGEEGYAEMAEKRFAGKDKDGDGSITKEEFVAPPVKKEGKKKKKKKAAE